MTAKGIRLRRKWFYSYTMTLFTVRKRKRGRESCDVTEENDSNDVRMFQCILMYTAHNIAHHVAMDLCDMAYKGSTNGE